MKTCSKCTKEQPIENFRIAKTYKDGRHSQCRSCETDYARTRKSTIVAVAKVETKICKRCGKEKTSSEFSLSKTCADGLDPRCKECYRDITRIKRGGLQELTDKKRNTPDNTFWCKFCEDYLPLTNRVAKDEFCCKGCRGKRNRKKSAYDSTKRKAEYQAHPEKAKRHLAIRRGRIKSAKGQFTISQLAARFSYYGNRCIYCQDTESLSVEHLIPLSRGGSNWPANLAPSCLTCNLQKGTKTHQEFLAIRACPVR